MNYRIEIKSFMEESFQMPRVNNIYKTEFIIRKDDEVYLCVHFSLRPKEGMIEIEEAPQTETNLFVELKSKEVSGLTIRGKILGAGNFFDYEHNEEDVLLVITEIELIKMKVLVISCLFYYLFVLETYECFNWNSTKNRKPFCFRTIIP